MSYILVGILVFLSFWKPRNKSVFFLITIFLIVLCGLNTVNPDYKAYRLAYMNPYKQVTSIREPLFIFLYRFFYKLSVGYQWVNLFIAIIAVSIMQYSIFSLSPYPNIVSVLFLIYPFTVCVVQIRSYISLSFVMLGITLYLEFRADKKKAMFLLLLFIMVATLFHYSAIIYSIVFIAVHEKVLARVSYVLTFMIAGFMVILNANAIVSIVKKFVDDMKIKIYIMRPFVESSNHALSINSVLYIFLSRFAIIFICLVYMYARRVHVETIEEAMYIDDNRILFRIALYSTVASVLLEIGVSTVYARISRLPLVLSYIMISRCIYRTKESKIGLWFVSIGYTLTNAFVSFFTQGTILNSKALNQFDGVFRAVLENNLIF